MNENQETKSLDDLADDRPVEQVRGMLGLVTPEELATAIRVEDNTLAVWRSRGLGPSFTKLGKTVFYLLEDLLTWIKNNRVTLLEARTPKPSPPIPPPDPA